MSNELQDVLGGILSALAQGRNQSDRVSKELSIQYEQDDLMRAFPVPRVELEHVQIELKFAVTAQPPTTTEADTMTIPRTTTAQVAGLTATATIDPTVVTRLVQNSALNAANKVANSINELTIGSVYGIAPHQGLMYRETEPIPDEYPRPIPDTEILIPVYDLTTIHQVSLEMVTAVILETTRVACATPPQPGVVLETFPLWAVSDRVVRELTNRGLIQFMNGTTPAQVTEQLANFILPPVKQTHETEVMRLRSTLVQPTPTEPVPTVPVPTEPDTDSPPPPDSDVNPAPTTPTAPQPTTFGIVTRYQDLALLPPEIISTLKMSINVKNYEWTKVDEQDGQAVRKLVQE